MTKDEAIKTISSLYPTDSVHQRTSNIGKELLREAREFVNEWQNESTEVLVKYAELCQERHRKEYKEWLTHWEL